MTRMSDEERNRRERDRRFRSKYGITLEEYEERYEAQGGLCAICRRPQAAPRKKPGKAVRRPAPRLAVDHNHDTGQVRGLLCANCNHKLIGRWKDPAVLRAAADYLEGGTVKGLEAPREEQRRGLTDAPDGVRAVDVPASNEAPPTGPAS